MRERFGGVRAGDRGERERVGGRASASGDERRRDERGERGGAGARRRVLERANDDGEMTTGEASDRCGDADAVRRGEASEARAGVVPYKSIVEVFADESRQSLEPWGEKRVQFRANVVAHDAFGIVSRESPVAVSYTHLTLPTT